MYKRKTKDVFLIEQCFNGKWEEVCEEETRKDAIEQVKCYRENQPEIPVRRRQVRVKL